VPYSIVKNEMAGKSASYFSRNNYEITGRYSDGLPQVRQKPGPRNALGRVKFLFPNSYSIYFHDTPSKGLFEQTYRAASHGCVRLGEPEKMANWILSNDANWSQDSVRRSLQLTKETHIKLRKPIPVFIGYFTAWVDQQGKLNFRDDIYGHDKKMMEKLFADK
jgi:murein L,D-transpeptidase YcbB/YkuD